MQPGWYPDPDDENARRYWDGQTWSAPLSKSAIAGNDGAPVLPDGGGVIEPSRNKRGLIIASAAAVLLVAAAVAAFVVKHQNDQADERAAAASSSVAASRSAASLAASESRSRAAEARESRAAQARELAKLERVRRNLIIKSLEKSVTKDAKGSVSDGLLDGPIKFTDCTPVGGGSTDILTDKTGQFECIAVTMTSLDGTERGYRYSATINWDKASYSWHIGD